MNRQREAAEQVSVIEDIPDNTTEGQVDGGKEEGNEDWSRSPMQGEKVQPNGNVWSWSPYQSGMSSHHLHSGWSWSPITSVQHKYCGRWSWSPSQLKILPYATQEQSESDVQGQPPLTDVNCWPVFIDTYRPKRKRTRKRRRSKKFGPYRYKREGNWKTLTCVTGPTQSTESQVSPNTKQCDSYSCVSKMTLSTSQTQRVSSICPQREINNPCLRSTGVDEVLGRSTSPAQESKAERNITSSLQNSNEMSSKSSLSVSETSRMNEHPGVWQKSVIDTQKKSEEQTLPSIFQVDEEQKLINNSFLNYEHNKSEGIRNKANTSVSKMEEKSGTLQKISLPQSEEDRMNDVDAISSSKYNADQAENLHASTLETDKVNNLPRTLTSQSKIAAADVSTVQVNDSPLPHDSVEIIEMHENRLRHTFTPALDEFEEKKVLETVEKRQTYESEMEGFKETKSSLPEVEKGNIPQSQNFSPSYETDKRNSSITDGNNLFNKITNTINNKKTELLCSDDRGAEEKNHSLSQIEFNNSRQICNSRSPSPVDKLISGGLKYSLSFELLDMPGGMAINTDSSRICKQVQSSTTGLSDDPSSQHSTSISPNEENANQVYSSDSYPGSFSSVNCDNLKHRASLLNEKKSSTTFSGCPSVKEDSLVLDGAVENINMKSCQAKEAANAMIDCENESSHSLIPENKCLENSINNKTEENKEKQNILSVNKNTSEPKCTLTRTRTLTLPYTETEKFSSVSISGTKSTISEYKRFEYGKTEDCKSLIEELELISKKSSSSSASNEKNLSVLQKDLPSPLRSVDSCHVKSQCSLLTNKDNGSDLEADNSEATSLLQKNMTSTLDSDSVIAETEGFSASPQNEVKYSTIEFMSTEPKSPSTTKGFSPRGSKSLSPAEKRSSCKSRSSSPDERSVPCESNSSFPAQGPWGSNSPSVAKGVSPKRSLAKGPLLEETRNPFLAETLTETVSSSSLIEGPLPCGSKSPSSVKASSPQGSRSPSSIEGSSSWRSKSAPGEGSLLWKSRSPSLAEDFSPRRSRSSYPAKEISLWESRSPFLLVEGFSPRGSRSPSHAEGLSPRGSRSPTPAEGLLPRGSRSPSPAEGLSPQGSRSPSPAEGLLPQGTRSPSPTEGLSPQGSRSPSPAEGLSPRGSRSPSPAEGLLPRGSRSPSPAEGLLFHEFRNPFPDKILLPQEPKSLSPAEGLSLSRNSSSVEGPTPQGSKSPSHAQGFSPRKSRSPSPATESFLMDSRGPSPVEGFSPKEYKSPSLAKESLPMEPRSPSSVKGSSNKEFRSSSPVKGTSHKESRNPSPSERLSPWGSKILSPALWGSKSPLPAKGPSNRVSKSSSSVKGAILGRSRSLSPVKESSLQESKRQSLLKESSHQRCMSTMPDERPSLQRSRSSSPAGKLSLRVSRSLSLTEGHITQGSKSLSHIEKLSTWGSKSPPLTEEPSFQRSRSPSPIKELSITMSKSLTTNEGPSFIGPRNPYLPDFKSLQLVDNRAITLHSKDKASNVWCKVSSSQYFHPNDKTRTPPPQSETVNIQVDITCTVEAGGFQEVTATTPPSGVKRKHSECSVEEITIDNSQQRKKIATDPTETLNAILRKIHGKSILEFSTSHKTACRKSIVTRAVTRRLAHRSPNHDLHHVASARMEIFEAVESGDFEKVQELMQDTGPAVRRKDTHCTLLHEAVNHRQVDMVLFFLKYISPNVVNKEGSTPGHLAARKGYTQILRLLLADSEVDPNKRDLFNNTYKNWLTLPLLEAVVGDNRARIQELLRLGADPDHSAKPPEDWFADRNMEITTARQLAHALQRDNVLPLFKRKSVEDDLKSVEDDDVNKALPELLFPKKINDMDNEFMQLVDTSVAVARGPDVYRMDATLRGYVCILSYGSFHDRPDLHLQGSQTDAHNLANTFSKMGYRGHAHFSLTAGQTRQQLAKVRDMELLKRAGCAVFIISSHGEPRRHFLTSDMQTIDIQWVLDFFKDSQCPYLKNKPKLFIWDLCRGHQEQESGRGKTHGELCGRVDEPLRDVMCLDSSSGGFTWHAFSEEGTPFIGALCSVVARHAATKELIELYREFLKEYATAAPDAVPQLTNYGFNKKFYI